MLFYFIYFLFGIVWSESILRFIAFGSPALFEGYFWMFSACAALLCALICGFFKGRGRFAAAIVLSFALCFYYAVNVTYRHIFGSFLSVSQLGMGKQVVSTFGTETMIGIMQCIVPLMMLLVPLAALLVYRRRSAKKKSGFPEDEGLSRAQRLTMFAALFTLHAAVLSSLPLAGVSAYSPYDIYHKTLVLPMDQRLFGSLTSTRLEISEMIAPEVSGMNMEKQEVHWDIGGDDQAGEPEDNIMNIDFAALCEKEEDERIETLHQYFMSQSPSCKNEYTGMFSGYNIIEICAESFSPYLVDETRTPILYKMMSEGWNFTNYYDTICDNTSNSEYTLLTGLLPDLSLLGRGFTNFKDYNSSVISKDNYLPFCLGTQLTNDGYKSWAFHYDKGSYYDRIETHPNFGYDFYSAGDGLRQTFDWPSSDLDMMEQAVPMVLDTDNGHTTEGAVLSSHEFEPFGIYFMTFSGHMQYNFMSNKPAKINKEISESLDVDEDVKAYVSCNQELEKALEYLIGELSDAGVLDRTLFIFTQDHYPYGLGLEKLSQLAGKSLNADSFDAELNKYKGAFWIWSPSMEDGKSIDTVCCELDILPTLLNLLGMEYDSRLLMGRDIFSDSEKIAVLQDRSFVTENIIYNSYSGETRFKDDADEADLDRLINIVKNKFTVSKEMLYTDYYAYIRSYLQSERQNI